MLFHQLKWLKDAFWKHIKQPLSLSPPPHPVVREKSEDLAKRWASPINHFIFSAKWIYSKMRYAASARLLAVTQSSARAWMRSARTRTLVQPWQGTPEPHWQDAMHAEPAAGTGCFWQQSGITSSSSGSGPMYLAVTTLSSSKTHSITEAPPSLLESTLRIEDTLFDWGRQGRSDLPPKRLSGCDRAVKAAQLESLSWLVAWLSCFAALQGNLA